ncbi:arginine N-succinyltransferase [Blastopirellula sp. JC732]|uniref:Arginine N-succinyltransferase n=1 Tax=Blastopirellula sediminis TaxID=2894196 RepID=A0A9X1MJ65_9BACT|nr:arginine N-succinyltransferase [Blastopirellula sediminis]MCC9609165.1 arginine N-succinyltransferase [Blastopirellula sediminis]MCC9628058.1 arginine N-succinyltransferase [Blastopirellula sediminis]
MSEVPLLVVRPVRIEDLGQLNALAHLTATGLTTLPRDESLMEKRVKQAVRTFSQMEDDSAQHELFLFVMEEKPSGQIVGTCGIVPKVGGFKPFYAYRLGTDVHESETLKLRYEHKVLHLLREHDGPTEIGSLFLRSEYRGGGTGRVLSLCRFLFMANHPSLFESEVIAELRGVIDDDGVSPFWEALGHHFFGIDFPNADMLSLYNKEFIEKLMPRHPIYVTLLPKEAQASIGEVHRLTAPARRLLEGEGLRWYDLVDIFEAGPILQCKREEIRAVRESRVDVIAAIDDHPDGMGPYRKCIATTVGKSFLAAGGLLYLREDGLVLEKSLAAALEVQPGESVRYVDLRAEA